MIKLKDIIKDPKVLEKFISGYEDTVASYFPMRITMSKNKKLNLKDLIKKNLTRTT
tara:strand:+ start:1823 stop:1990 length:168 start_codon:yes stop_codon:yes gene_type:complete